MATPSVQPTKHAATIVSSIHGRRFLYIFLLAVLTLFVGLGSIVWPRVTIHLTPEFELVRVTVPLKVDLEVIAPVPTSELVPGKLVSQQPGAEPFDQAAYYTAAVPGGTLAVSRKLVDQLVSTSLQQAAGEERTVRPGSTALAWQPPSRASSGHLYSWPVRVEAYFYRAFPITLWRQHLAGLPVTEAVGWLKAQVGVAGVQINFYPHFLANISQKIPFNPSNLSFSLDIN